MARAPHAGINRSLRLKNILGFLNEAGCMQLQRGLKSNIKLLPSWPRIPQLSQSPVTPPNFNSCVITFVLILQRCNHNFIDICFLQIIDGRYHTECGHFYSMSTLQKDCGRYNCLFSSRHTPGLSCLNHGDQAYRECRMPGFKLCSKNVRTNSQPNTNQ